MLWMQLGLAKMKLTMLDSKINSEQPLSVVDYPLWMLLVRHIAPMITVFFLFYLFIDKEIRIELVAFMAIWLLLVYLIGQYRYARYSVCPDRIRKHFIASLYLKDREYFFSDVKLFFFQLHTKPGGGDEYVTMYFHNGKRKRLYIPKNEIFEIRNALTDLKMPVQSSRVKWDKPDFNQ